MSYIDPNSGRASQPGGVPSPHQAPPVASMGDSTAVAAAQAKHLEENPPDDALTGFDEGGVEAQSLGSVQALSVEDEGQVEGQAEGDEDAEDDAGQANEDAEDGDDDGDGDERDLDELSHAELLNIAAEQEIPGRHQMKKADLLAEVRERQ